MDNTQQQQENLLKALLLTTIVGGLFIIAMVGLLDREDLISPEVVIGVLGILGTGGLYLLARIGYVQIAAGAFIILTALVFLIAAYQAAPALLPFLIVPIILTSIFYSPAYSAFTYMALGLIILILNQMIGQQQTDFWDLQTYWYFYIFAGALVIVFAYHTQKVESQRRRRLEEANAQLRESERLLEHRVQERTAELQHAYEQVQALNLAKDEFVSNVSHELRTPITNIKLHHFLLQHNQINGQERQLEILERETGRLEALVESLLLLSRFDQERVKLNKSVMDLNDLARQYGEDRMMLVKEKALRLEQALYPKPLPVEIDASIMGQAVSIVLTNALHYTPAGGCITLSTRKRRAPAGPQVGICVQDTGPGISAADQAHLFERFYRGRAARETKVDGTGLGLAIAHQIMQRHQGEIEVQSSGIAGEGACFSLWLPLVKDGLQDQSPTTPSQVNP